MVTLMIFVVLAFILFYKSLRKSGRYTIESATEALFFSIIFGLIVGSLVANFIGAHVKPKRQLINEVALEEFNLQTKSGFSKSSCYFITSYSGDEKYYVYLFLVNNEVVSAQVPAKYTEVHVQEGSPGVTFRLYQIQRHDWFWLLPGFDKRYEITLPAS